MCSVGDEVCGLPSRSVVMVMPFLGLAAPITACEAITRRQAGWSRTGSGRSASGGRRAAAILSRDAKPEAHAVFRVGHPAAENSRRPPLRPRPACRPIALSQAAGAAFRREGITAIRLRRPACSSGRSGLRQHEPAEVLQEKLVTQRCPKCSDAELAQVIVEVLEARRERDRLDAGGLRSRSELVRHPSAGRVVVLRDIEAPQRGWWP